MWAQSFGFSQKGLLVGLAWHPSHPSVTPLHHIAESELSPCREFSVTPAAALVFELSCTHQQTCCCIGCTFITVSLVPLMRCMDGFPVCACTCAP
eukprot:7404082-Ditylum_brightwellii.AAC.1